MLRLRDLMTWKSQWRYLWWRLWFCDRAIVINLTNGLRLSLDPLPSHDITTACEIFVCHVYASPRPLKPQQIKTIVDLGANVGFSCLYFAQHYPQAQILSLEPHPQHVQRLVAQISQNQLQHRIHIIAAAAACQEGTTYLTNASVCSTVVAQPQPGTLPIAQIDVFPLLQAHPPDLLKMDIEGGEFAILADCRFALVRPATIVVEYHQHPQYPNAQGWCRDRLHALGYDVVEGAWQSEVNGILWGYLRD